MAFNKQSDVIIALLTTALILLPGIATTNVDCKGKAFHCVNSTHFKICVDFGGVSKTVDDFLIPCPQSTACAESNYYECEIPTTSAPLARQSRSDVTNELFKTTVTSPWELLDVITLSPRDNNEKSVEWLENSTTASPEIVSTAAGTETVAILDYKVVNEVIIESTTESDYIIHKTTASDLSESNNSKSTNSILNSYITSLAMTDETNDLSGHKISANISSALVIAIGNDSTTETKIWMDVFDTMTTSPNTKDDADFKSTNLFNSVVSDSLNKNNLSAEVATENYSGTKSEILIDLHKPFIAPPDADIISTTLSFLRKTNDFRLNIPGGTTKNYTVTENDTSISMLEQVETTPKNIEERDNFATTLSSAPMKTDDLGLKSSLATETTEKSGNENETLITNNKVNTYFTTTLLVPMMNESILNTPHIEINLSVTSDSYSTSTEQYSTVSDIKNSPTESATTTNEMNTNANVNGTGTENKTLITDNKVNPHFTTTTSTAPMITEGLLNTPNIEIYLTATSDSYSTSTEKYSTVSDIKNSPTESATTTNEMNTNANVNGTGTENKTLITDNKVNPHFTTTTLSAPMMTESLINTPNIEINLSVTSDSYSTSTEQYSTVSDIKNSPTESATTTNEKMNTNANVNGTGTENKTLITNNKVNPHFTTTTLTAPTITEGLLNTPNIEIYLTDTTDSNSASTEQYSTVSDKNTPTETATTTNELYTKATVTDTGTTNEILITNNKVNPYFTTTTLSAPMMTESLINTPNIEINLSVTSDSYSTSTEQYSTVSDIKNSPTESATTTNEMNTNANVNGTGTENKTLITNNKVNPHFTTTTPTAPMITEGLLNTPNIEIYLTATSDSNSASTEPYSTVSDKNTPTETAKTNELYTNATVTDTGTTNAILITNNEVNPNFTTTTLSAAMITDSLINIPNIEINLSVTSDSYLTSTEQYSTVSDIKNSPTESATTTNEMNTNANVNGTGTENKTLITDNKVNPHFTTTTSTAPMITEGLLNTPNIEIYLTATSDSNSGSTEQYSTVSDKNTSTETATTTNELYTNATVTDTGTRNETLITNSEVNRNIATTTLSADMITEILINTQNIEINFTGTSDSNSAGTEQYSTVRDNNSPTETAASTNQMYTNAVTKTFDIRLDDYSLNENGMNINRIDEISSSSSIHMEFRPTTAENVVLKDTLQVSLINEQNNLSSAVKSVFSLNAENVTSSDITKFTTVTDLDQTNIQANVVYTKAPIVNENIILDTDGTSTTKLDVTINESNLIRENISNSSTDINLTTRSDSSETNVHKNMPEKDINSSTPTTRIVSDIYTTVMNNKFQVDEFSMYENDSSTIPLSDFRYEEELHSTTAVIVLKSTADTILTQEQSDISLQKSESHAISDKINNELLETTTLQLALTIDLTVNSISDDVNFSTSTVNGEKNQKNVAKKISNNTKEEFLRHENGTYENIVDEITTPLPQIADFKSTAKTEKVAASLRDSLNDTVEELTMIGKTDLSPPVTAGSLSVSEITKTSFLSDVTESYYVVNTEEHIDVAKVKFPIFSTIDETMQNIPTTQNIGTDKLDGTEDENGSTRSVEIQLHEKITNFDSVSTPSVLLHFSKYNDNVTESVNNRLKENDSHSNIMYGSSHPLNLSTYTTKENVFTLTNVAKDSSQIFVTNEKPIHTATIYRNVNSSIKLNTLKGTKVVELEQLVSEHTNKINASDTSDIGSLTTENTLSLNPTLSKNISRQHILSANINKDINATKEKPTRDSAMSGGLYVQDKILKSVKSNHLQNTSIITNESPQYHKNNNTYNFTKQTNNSVAVNTKANLYNANVKNIKLKNTEKKLNQTLDPVSKSIVNFNNSSINVENLTRYDQNSSYKIVPNKTRIGDLPLHFVNNADKKQSLSNPVQTNEDKRKVHITKITPVKLNNLPSDYDIERTEFKFNCDSRQRGKYSNKNDCQNFYICTGRDEPIIGKCPNNTVFSEILKQCTRNFSHCIRNNQFQCTSAGRFVDILSDKFYYICAKRVKGYIRFKFQCQKGYHLDQSKLKCILDTFNESLFDFELSSLDMDMANEESSKTDGEKSTIESRSKEEKDSKKQKKDFECKKEGKFLYPDDCRKYYQCSKTGESKFRRKIKKCDSDEVFDNELRKCVDEESYEC